MPEDLDGLVRDLQASRARLLSIVSGVSEEQFKRRPAVADEAAAGEWSIAEVLAHLLASEQRQAARLVSLLAGEDGVSEAVSDEERTAEARQGRAVPVPQIIHGLLAARRQLERTLTESSLTEAPERVSALLRDDVIEHEAAHARQIEAVKAALGAARASKGVENIRPQNVT